MEVKLSRALRVLTWNERLLKIAGVWPCGVNDIIFIPVSLYLSIHIYLCSAGYFVATDWTDCMEITLELNTWSTVFFKLAMYRLNKSTLNHLITEMREDLSKNHYRSTTQLSEYLQYNNMSSVCTKLAVLLTSIPAMLYYTKPMITTLVVGQFMFPKNSTLATKLPNRMELPFEVTEIRMYIMLYVYQGFVVPIIVAGFAGTDTFLITLTLHICGQYAVIARQIEESINSGLVDHRTFRHWISLHQRLIRMSDAVNSSFKGMLLYEFLSVTAMFCFVWYNVILALGTGQYVTMVTFALVQNATLLSLFGYCFVGECLIRESAHVSDQLYNSNWYDIPQIYKKYILIIMLRSQRPVVLTASKLIIFSCETFTSIVKSSAAYVSFLQNML